MIYEGAKGDKSLLRNKVYCEWVIARIDNKIGYTDGIMCGVIEEK